MWELQLAHDKLVRESRDEEVNRQGNVCDIYRETRKIVDRLVYLNTRLDGDGTRLHGRAVSNAGGGHNQSLLAESPKFTESPRNANRTVNGRGALPEAW